MFSMQFIVCYSYFSILNIVILQSSLSGEGKPGWGGTRSIRKFGFTDIKYLYNRGHWKVNLFVQ